MTSDNQNIKGYFVYYVNLMSFIQLRNNNTVNNTENTVSCGQKQLTAIHFEVNRTIWYRHSVMLQLINVKVLVEWSKPTQMYFLTSHASCPLAPSPSSTPSPSSEEHLSNLVSKQPFPISRARFHKTLTHPFKESVKLFWPHQVFHFIWIFWFLKVDEIPPQDPPPSALLLLYLLFSPSAFV